MDTENVTGQVQETQEEGSAWNGRITREVLDKLIAAVDVDNFDVDEYTVLGNIMVRAGLMWRCIRPGCNCVNHDNCSSCDHCGGRRSSKRLKPIADTWA